LIVTSNGEFTFDGSSGGITSIVYMCWKIFLCAQSARTEFVVTIDEPENHLHPAMQQTLVTALVNHFENAQFIISTHSPFVVNCWPECKVYALRFVNERVSSQLLNSSSLTSTPDEILKEVLGLPFTMPIWAANRLEPIVEKYSEQIMTARLYRSLSSELADAGLNELMPETLEIISKRPEDD
jgi:hypothetical protein